jgi:hypothetical protein
MLPQIASDGEGGAFVCWRDARNGDYDIYAQHIGADGRMLWLKNGIPIVVASYNQQFPRMISDGSGGAFIAWEDDRSLSDTFIYAQRIDGTGHNQWTAGGVKVAEKPGLYVSLAADGRGGVLLGWNGPNINNILVQRLDSLGTRVWSDSGVQVSARVGDVSANDIGIVGDDGGGAIIAWSQANQVFAQRVDSLGSPQWALDGNILSDTANNFDVSVTADFHGGAVVSWTNRDTLKFTQRVSYSGQPCWGQSGIILGVVAGGGARRHTADSHGGAFIGHSRYIQHIDTTGAQLWPGQGTAFTAAPTLYFNSTQARNGTRGIWNFWSFDTSTTTSIDIFGQYIDNSGVAHWGALGIPICIAPNMQDWARATSDDEGHAIIAWDDFRNGHSNVYCARVDTGGVVTAVESNRGLLPEGFRLDQNFPNPFNPETTISFSLPTRSRVKLSVYNILGQELTVLMDGMQEAGHHNIKFNADHFSSGVYFYRLITEVCSETRTMLVLR